MMTAADSVFDAAFAAVVGVEGGWDTTASDRGNWTGGAVGVGALKGTKFGVSAAAYPTLDIRNLTIAEARSIYHFDYWAPLQCDAMPPCVAWLVFDCAVNQGKGAAAKILQEAVCVPVDLIIGPQTLAAVRAAREDELFIEVHARRGLRYATTNNIPTFGLGWYRRLARIVAQART